VRAKGKDMQCTEGSLKFGQLEQEVRKFVLQYKNIRQIKFTRITEGRVNGLYVYKFQGISVIEIADIPTIQATGVRLVVQITRDGWILDQRNRSVSGLRN
jgi:hypothetical protein